jgi:hypothetical protein
MDADFDVVMSTLLLIGDTETVYNVEEVCCYVKIKDDEPKVTKSAPAGTKPGQYKMVAITRVVP